ncbi:MAG TPA: zinc-dependent peptidase [Cyclobacteriaceae bacterium]|nr:zinc-dependent peptidase [Cyclobacteriaceae bacterium]
MNTTLTVALALIVLLYFRLRSSVNKGYGRMMHATGSLRGNLMPVPAYFRDLLQKYFRYYQGLSAENKAVFERRVCRFIYAKRFIPRGMKVVPVEVKVFVAATAVQITFGLPNVQLTHFNKILIYPDNYYSTITQRYHKGEVNPAFGIIVLSMKNFMKGFLYGEDGVNLGLHEMAHALRIENIVRQEYAFFDQGVLERFDRISEQLCAEGAVGNNSIFRPYACTNSHEFFSVAVENFFERPVQFKMEHGDLYDIMVRLLNQDPILLQVNPVTPPAAA